MKEVAERLALWREHPSVMVREMFGVEPDPWQDDVLEAFPKKALIAMQAAKGPGKTAVEAWIGWNFLLTRPHPKCAATSVSGDNLRDNLWTEMAKWRARSEFLKDKFEWTKTRIFARDHPETWFMSARTWPQTADKDQQSATLAGLHAEYILFIIDEAGGVPDAVMVSAEAALSACTEGHIVIAGNPTHLEGPLYRASRTGDRLRWHIVVITGDPDSPQRSSRISVQWARDMIAKYGRDNPWVLVNVFGEFPPSSLNALIGPDEVRAAMGRYWRAYEIGAAAKILGVDVARFGDDSSIIFPRQGIQAFPFDQHRNLTSTQGAGLVARKINSWEADATFIDNSGGYGAGWIDNLNSIGKAAIGVDFSGQAHEPKQFYNKRAEMAFQAVEWIKAGGALPLSEDLLRALTQTTYTFAKGREGSAMILEPKEDVKVKLNGQSPDEFDAFILTFAEPVSAKSTRRMPPPETEYKPFRELDRQQERAYAGESGYHGGYDPFRGR